MKKERRKVSETISRMSIIAMLSALGFVLMAFAQFPYPLAPWLKVEVSEIVTLIAYALYGLPGGIAVAIIKTGLNLAVHGPVGLGIGDLTALFTSCMFILGLFLTSHVFKWFKKGIWFRILSYLFIAIFVSTILTALNAIVITPSYLTVFGPNPHFSTCFDEGVIQNVCSYITKVNDPNVNGGTYLGLICSIYYPFNLIKVAACCFVYEILFNRLIFVFMRKSEFFKRYFVGDIFHKENEKPSPNEDGNIEQKEN